MPGQAQSEQMAPLLLPVRVMGEVVQAVVVAQVVVAVHGDVVEVQVDMEATHPEVIMGTLVAGGGHARAQAVHGTPPIIADLTHAAEAMEAMVIPARLDLDILQAT